MTSPVWRLCRLIVWGPIACGWSAGVASAQPPEQPLVRTASLAAAVARVPIGDVVHVTDMTGVTLKGELTAVTDDAVQLKVRSEMRSVATADVRRIQWQQPDSPLTGVLIGAAIGATPGIYWLIADPNECNGMCPEEYALIAVGAVLGGVMDRAITRKVTVYAAGVSSGRAMNVTIGPLVMRDRKGVSVSVTFSSRIESRRRCKTTCESR
jgi:hypothetical protein